MVLIRSILFGLLIATHCFGAKAVIDGPTTAQPGDLVVLNATASEGAAFRWIIPERLQTLSCSELELGFASGRPGSYTFMLIAADTADGQGDPIDYVTHTVTIGEAGTQPDPEPIPQPPSNYAQLQQLAKEKAALLDDGLTSRGLAQTIGTKCTEIERLCEQGQCPTLLGAKTSMVTAIENRLLARTGNSRNAPWDGWRTQINLAIGRLNLTTVEQYVAAMKAVAKGLSES
jgi:hypothetical protein